MRTTYRVGTAMIVASATLVGCSKGETSAGAVAQDSSSAMSSAAAASAPNSSGITPVRGRIASVSDSALTVSSSTGDVRVVLEAPVHVYTREPAQLSRVTEGSFVGITSVAQPDGSQRATEIHIFPEELRGTGEGSYLMGQQGASGNPSRMTNGAVGASRMTNGSVGGQAGGTLTVNYSGGSQSITVPAGVTVTAIAPTQTKLTPGANVVVLAAKQPDGTLKASRVMLSGR